MSERYGNTLTFALSPHKLNLFFKKGCPVRKPTHESSSKSGRTIADIKLPFFLVASPQLKDPNFAKAVVLLVEHNHSGSLGFIVNRPLGIKLSELVGKRDYDIPRELVGWFGGPVKTDTGIVLYSGDAEQAEHGFLLSSAESALKQLVESAGNNSRHGSTYTLATTPGLYAYRFLVGYSGWGQGQLAQEMLDGTWLQVPYDRHLLFDTNWKTLWERSLLKVGVNPRALVAPSHPYLN